MIVFCKDYIRNNSLLSLIGIFLIMVLSGCAAQNKGGGTEKPGYNTADRVFSELASDFESERSMSLMDLIHDDFDDGTNNRLDLRNALQDVYQQYSNIHLEFYGFRVNENNGGLTVDTNWNLRWVCEERGTGCRAGDLGDFVKRSGQTTFQLQKDGDEWKIVSQGKDRLLGNFSPPRRL